MESSVTSARTVKDLLQNILERFQQRLYSKVPLELKHSYSFIDEPMTFSIGKIEKKQAWQSFILKLFDFDNPDEGAVANCVKKFGTTTRYLIKQCVVKHKAFKAKAESLVSKYIDVRCKKIKTSIEEIQLLNPGLIVDLKGFLKTEKSLAFSAFQHEFRGKHHFYEEQKRILKKKLQQLENELVTKQQRNVASGPTKCAKVSKYVLVNADDGTAQAQSDSMIVNTSASSAVLEDDVETGNNDVEIKGSRSLKKKRNVMSNVRVSERGNQIKLQITTGMQLRSRDKKLLKCGHGLRRSQTAQKIPLIGKMISKQSNVVMGSQNIVSMRRREKDTEAEGVNKPCSLKTMTRKRKHAVLPSKLNTN